MTDEDVESFLRAISDLGKANQRGWAAGEDVIRRMDWDPSDLRLRNPGNEAAVSARRRYRALAEYCDDEGYITKESDSYWVVAITPEGEKHISGG